MLIVAPLLCGLIFGAGLLVSGMVQPTKVLGFLDIFGAWDPSLAVVMAGGAGCRNSRLHADRPSGPADPRASIFLAEQRRSSMRRFCLGPGCSELVGAWLDCVRDRRWKSLATLSPGVFVFVVAMAAGMIAHGAWQAAQPIVRRDGPLATDRVGRDRGSAIARGPRLVLGAEQPARLIIRPRLV